MIRAALWEFLCHSGVVDKGSYYPLWIQRWDDLQEPLPKPAVRNLLDRLIGDYRDPKCTHFYEDTSFPFGDVAKPFARYVADGSHRGHGRHPGIGDMLRLMDDLVEFRIVVMYRPPQATVRSTLRRGFSNDLELECQLAESIHRYVADELRCLSPQIYRTCQYDAFIREPEAHLMALSDWWEIEAGLIAKGRSRIRQPSSEDPLSPEEGVFLDDYFSEAKVSQWLDVYHTNPLVPS